MGIIFPAKGYFPIREIYKPVVGNGNAVRVARQVIQQILRAAKRRFRIDHPAMTMQGPQERAELFLVREYPQITREAKLSLAESRFSPATNLPRKTRLSTPLGRKNR